MTPYYKDDFATLFHADCRTILPELETGSVDAVVTDPPYGEAMGFDNDDNPEDASCFTGEVFLQQKRVCRAGCYAACFWTMRSLDLILDCLRSSGWSYYRMLTMHVAGTARPYLSWLPRVQPIILIRNGVKPNDLHDAFSVWLKTAIAKSGLSLPVIAKELNVDSRLIMKWSRYRDPSWCLPTPRHYPQLKKLLNLPNDFDSEIMERLHSDNENRHYRHDLYQVTSGSPTTKHPAEKPLSVVSHICTALTDGTNGLILDPFCGSGTTLRAAKDAGLKAIGIEINEEYCAITARRLEQNVLSFTD